MSGSQSLEEILDMLIKCCEDERWDEISALDESLRLKLSFFIEQAKSDKQKELLVRILTRVQSVYRLVADKTTKHRDELKNEISQLSKDKRAVNKYLDSAGY